LPDFRQPEINFVGAPIANALPNLDELARGAEDPVRSLSDLVRKRIAAGWRAAWWAYSLNDIFAVAQRPY
jgi:hypothetical protein